MHFIKRYGLRDVCGESLLIPTVPERIDFTTMLQLNETAADFYRNFQNRGFEVADAVAFFVERYEVDAKQATGDVEKMLEVFKDNGIVED